MAARLRFIVITGIMLLSIVATTSHAQTPPSVSSGGAMRRLAGHGIPLRDAFLAGRIGGFVTWAAPRWLPGAGRPTRTFESTPVRPRAFQASRSGRSRLP